MHDKWWQYYLIENKLVSWNTLNRIFKNKIIHNKCLSLTRANFCYSYGNFKKIAYIISKILFSTWTFQSLTDW